MRAGQGPSWKAVWFMLGVLVLEWASLLVGGWTGHR